MFAVLLFQSTLPVKGATQFVDWHICQVAAVHPHVCGEHTRQRLTALRDGRFIPTCVGNMQQT